MPVREASEWPRVWVVIGQTLLDSVPTRFEIMWPPGTPRRDRTHTQFRAHSSQLGSANRYRWLAPADSRCEDMPNTTPPPLSQQVPLARPGRLSL